MKAEQLIGIGFKEIEAKVYLTLLEIGDLQAGIISKRTGINRRTIYDTLERLKEKGLVSYTLSSNRRVFRAVNPNIILSKIKDIEKQANEIVPELQNLYKESKTDPEVEVYSGRKGIRNILNELLQVKEYLGFGSNEKFPEIMKHDFDLFEKIKKEKGVKSKTLMSIEMKNKSILKTAYNIVYRFIPDEFSLPTSIFIYKNKVAIIIWSQNHVGIVIGSEEVSNSFKQYFQALWKTAKN